MRGKGQSVVNIQAAVRWVSSSQAGIVRTGPKPPGPPAPPPGHLAGLFGIKKGKPLVD